MDLGIPSPNANHEARRPRWPRRFRHVASFLYSPARWARGKEIPWSEDLERLREDALRWLYWRAGAPRIWPDGRRDALSIGALVPATARRVVRTVNRMQRSGAVDALDVAKELMGNPEGVSFPPIVAEIAYELAQELGVKLNLERAPEKSDRSRTQWAIQTVIQRVINALAEEANGKEAASDVLERVVKSAWPTEQHPAAKQILSQLRSRDASSRIVRRVKELLAKPAVSSFTHLGWLESQKFKVMVMPDGTPNLVVPSGWLRRAGDFLGASFQPTAVERALTPVLQELEGAEFVRWGICPLCVRAFPKEGKIRSKACPPCRRKWNRRQIQWRLKHAPNEPVAFFVAPPSSRESVWLVIAARVNAPAALRRIAHAPPSAEDGAALEAALGKSQGKSPYELFLEALTNQD